MKESKQLDEIVRLIQEKADKENRRAGDVLEEVIRKIKKGET